MRLNRVNLGELIVFPKIKIYIFFPTKKKISMYSSNRKISIGNIFFFEYFKLLLKMIKLDLGFKGFDIINIFYLKCN